MEGANKKLRWNTTRTVGGKENQTGTDADMEKRIQNVDGN
jgi:hypothetical protein